MTFPNSTSEQLPKTATYGFPIPGTLHPSGNLAAVKVWTNRGYLPLVWTVTIHLTPRPGYNTGGLTTANAPLVHDNDILHLSLTNNSTKNYYKVMLKPGGTLNVTGTMTNDWTATNAQIIVRVYNAAEQYVGLLSSTLIPPQSTVPISVYSTYTNSSAQTAPYYISLERAYASADLSASAVQVHAQEAQLTLFLDADQNFSPDSPHDDSPEYLPCSRLDGASLPLAECPQTVRVIAAYTAGGLIVAPPTSGSVTFSLQDTSAFTGIAMNYGTGTEPDFALAGGAPTITVSFASNARIVSVDLISRDYGGHTTIRAQDGSRTTAMQLPKDEDGNWLPDGGWYADGDHLPDPGVPGTADADSEPAGIPYSNRTWGVIGDGLTAYEEYRGFIVDGIHIRTHPDHKDVFVTFDPYWRVGYAADLRRAGFALHEIRGLGCGLGAVEHDSSGVINWARWNDGAGGDIPGTQGSYTPQKALRVTIVSTYIPGYFGFTKPLAVDPKVPIDVDEIEIWVDSTMALADPEDYQLILGTEAPGPYTTEQAQNEVRRTFAHEIGHGIAICHMNGCTPLGISESGRLESVMGGTAGGPPVDDPLSQYSSFDIGVARVQRRF